MNTGLVFFALSELALALTRDWRGCLILIGVLLVVVIAAVAETMREHRAKA